MLTPTKSKLNRRGITCLGVHLYLKAPFFDNDVGVVAPRVQSLADVLKEVPLC